MKKFLAVIIALAVSTLVYSQTDEIVKIDVDSECKSSIRKKQFKGQLYTNPVKIISSGYNKVHLGYGYKNNMNMLVFTYNEWSFTHLNITDFYVKINGIEFAMDKMVLFKKHNTVNAALEEVTQYQIGALINDEVLNQLSNLDSLSISYIKSPSQKSKVWEIKGNDLKELKESYQCFEKYSNKYREEYEANLKEYETNFRKSKWGESKEEVKDNESSEEIIELENNLVQDVTLNNDTYKAYYYFINGKFYQGVYDFEGEFINENNFYSKYNEVSKILSTKYGPPSSINKYRNGSLWDDSDEIGLALKMGEYSEIRRWETKDTKITLEITGENLEIDIVVRYRTKDKELLKEAEKSITKKSTEGF